VTGLEELERIPFRVDIVTLFPELFSSWLSQGVVSRAMERGIVTVSLVNLRSFGIGRHQVTDDYPFGGGAGMVMKPEPLFAAVESLGVAAQRDVILLSPQGRRFDHHVAVELSSRPRLTLIAGHYEGVDERVREHLATDEISIGDYVLSAGELAAMVVTDAAVRLLPGALAEESTAEESFATHLLEYPHYTRPAEFRGWSVPEVLLSGHHAKVAAWRRRQALLNTFVRRRELLQTAPLCDKDKAQIEAWQKGGDTE
jgi:tRNA (guanine37-N1)-methyltransferase